MLDIINDAYDQYCSFNQPARAHEPQQQVADKPAYGPVKISKLRGALAYLNPDCDEEEWKLKRLAPIARQARDYPEQAEELYETAKAWSRGDNWHHPSTAWITPGHSNGKTGEVAFDPEWQRFLNSSYAGNATTLGTIFHDAKEAGWVDEDDTFTRQEMSDTVNTVSTALTRVPPFQPLDPRSFPHLRAGQNGMVSLQNTIENTAHLLKGYGITVSFDVIKKDLDFHIPGHSGTPEGYRNTALTQVISLANLNNLSTQHIPSYIELIADQNPVNPVANWINSRPWDGIDRLPPLLDTLKTPDSYPPELKKVLLLRWSISVAAAALMPVGFRSRLVLTLQGPQSLGKSFWFKALINDPMLSDDVILTGHHLDASNKDTVITAVSHLITEFGEVDSSFKRDHARLKGFITNHVDKVRRPYGRGDSVYPRRTVFCASVNENNYLVDQTGNTRFGTIVVEAVNYQHGIDMQQYFAQMAVLFERGEQWWLTCAEEGLLERENSKHVEMIVIRERVLQAMDFDLPEEKRSYMSASQVLTCVGITHPTNHQARECGAALRQQFGEPNKIRGIMKWRVPIDTNPVSIG